MTGGGPKPIEMAELLVGLAKKTCGAGHHGEGCSHGC